MTAPELSGLQFFDKAQDYSVAWKRLPHWAQAGTVCFITWRTADSLPEEVLIKLSRRRRELLEKHGLNAEGDWKQSLNQLAPELRGEVQWSLFTAWDEQLDTAAGACWLHKPELSEIVLKSLRHFDGDRYLVTDAVVMPNHVHVLVAFRDEDALIAQCTSWKHYTATQINKWLRERGLIPPALPKNVSRGATDQRRPVAPRLALERKPTSEFWQVEQFDHLVRSPEHFDKYRCYIAENPKKANLEASSYRYYSKSLTSSGSSAPSSADAAESQSRSD